MMARRLHAMPTAQGPLAQLRYLEGRHVRLLYDMETKSGSHFAAGEVMRVLSTHRGPLELEALDRTGGRRWIRKVGVGEAAFIDEPTREEVRPGWWWESAPAGCWRLFEDGMERGTVAPSTKPRTGWIVTLAGAAGARWMRNMVEAEVAIRLREVG